VLDSEIQSGKGGISADLPLSLKERSQLAIAGDEMTREEFINLRKGLRLSQSEMAKIVGVHLQTVKRAEGKDRAGQEIPRPLRDRLENAMLKGLLRIKDGNR
jgi:hypothetical protein